MIRFTHLCKTSVVVAVLLVAVVACGNDESSRARNAVLVAGTSCTQPGQISKVPAVCAKTNTGNIWYPTMKSHGRSVSCTKPGTVLKKKAVVWVCGVAKGKKLWRATSPLPIAILRGNAVAEPGVPEPTPILDSTDVATPSRPVVADNNVLVNPAVVEEPLVTTPATVASTVPILTPSSVSSTVPVTTSSTVVPMSYRVGDTGPGGGIVFYDAGSQESWGRYLEAARANWDGTNDNLDPFVQWGCRGTSIQTSTAIGTGGANTSAIIAGCNPTTAASTARAYKGGGKTDWYLPSRDELEQMKSRSSILGFGWGKYHWSSSQYSLQEANSRYLLSPTASNIILFYWKDFGNQVRPIRAIQYTPQSGAVE